MGNWTETTQLQVIGTIAPYYIPEIQIASTPVPATFLYTLETILSGNYLSGVAFQSGYLI